MLVVALEQVLETYLSTGTNTGAILDPRGS